MTEFALPEVIGLAAALNLKKTGPVWGITWLPRTQESRVLAPLKRNKNLCLFHSVTIPSITIILCAVFIIFLFEHLFHWKTLKTNWLAMIVTSDFLEKSSFHHTSIGHLHSCAMIGIWWKPLSYSKRAICTYRKIKIWSSSVDGSSLPVFVTRKLFYIIIFLMFMSVAVIW